MLLPVEAAFWNGFALPVPWLVGTARLVLLALAWRSLTWSNPARRPLVPALEPTRRTPRRSPRR
jgi:hypothetical protein